MKQKLFKIRLLRKQNKIYYLFLNNMTNYESIMAILDSNHYAVVKDNEGDYFIFTKDFGEVKRSYWYDDLETVKQNVSRVYVNEEKINSFNIVEIYPLPRELPNIKVGDKVVIMENARKLDNFGEWSIEAQEMVNNGEYEIKRIENDEYGLSYWIYANNKPNNWRFPSSCVCKVYKEEKPQVTQEEIDKAIALLKYNGKIVDGKVLVG